MKLLLLLPFLLLAGCTSQQAYFCHLDDCSAVVIKEIAAAKKSVVFATYTFTEPSIGTAVILAHMNGISVKGIIEKRNINAESSQYQRFLEQGVDVKPDNNSALMHHKFFVIDNSIVITGSFNPTKAADESNDDNLVVIRNK
ncbi:MAG: phospholipase D-like domain-containing protein, partial [Candidatus Woesearchaeota archaeon]